MALFADVEDDPLSSDNFDPFANSMPSKDKTANLSEASPSSLFNDGSDDDDLFKTKQKEETNNSRFTPDVFDVVSPVFWLLLAGFRQF